MDVKRWRSGDHLERWVGSDLAVAERQFRRVGGIAHYLVCSLSDRDGKTAQCKTGAADPPHVHRP
jgi:hypothetical protein